MNCHCKKELEAKLTERFAEQQPKFKDHSVTLDGYCFAIQDKRMVEKAAMTYNAKGTYRTKGGVDKKKTIKGNMIFTYCPFCGTKA